WLESIQRGDTPFESLMDFLGLGEAGSTATPDDYYFLRVPGALAAFRAAVLRFDTRLVEIAKRPPEQHLAALEELDADLDGHPALAWSIKGVGKRVRDLVYGQAALRCGVVLLALDRYRLAHGRWPADLGALVPDFLLVGYTDPVDGQPLRYRVLADGVVVYSVGQNRQDDGGAVRETTGNLVNQPDIGFRLW